MGWYKRNFGEDTKNWFVLLFIREFTEIILQVIASFNYNGLNIFNKNEIELAYKQSDIKIFILLLSINSIIIGILWIFYLFKFNLCYGIFFKQIIFFIDTIFDIFYALFPIIVITNDIGINLTIAIGVLNTTNLYVFLFHFLSYRL